jgi:PHD/YefM family antitoxin component YafN of YafNO toxin-antitoxin module
MAGSAKKIAKNGERVGIREFRQNLAKYVLESDAPIVLTRHGDEVGYFIPWRKPPLTEEQKKSWRENARKVQQVLADAGVTEDEFLQEFDRLRKARPSR